MLGCLAIALWLLGHAAMGGCSSDSRLTGGGGCESFCSKWVGAHCAHGPTKDGCLEKCRDQQSRCAVEANAFLKCATLEAQIACETGSGQPRVLGCGARENALNSCLVCDRFCETWSGLDCPLGPGREECLATCLDHRCATEHQRIVECMTPGLATCGGDGRPAVQGISCQPAYDVAARCTQQYGQPQPFRWLAVEQPDTGGGT